MTGSVAPSGREDAGSSSPGVRGTRRGGRPRRVPWTAYLALSLLLIFAAIVLLWDHLFGLPPTPDEYTDEHLGV